MTFRIYYISGDYKDVFVESWVTTTIMDWKNIQRIERIENGK